MYLIVGLGNPGKKYEGTPHNAGFWFLDQLFIKMGHVSTEWQEKFDSQFIKTTKGFTKIVLLKPMTMMNKSGKAVQEVASYYRVSSNNIWVAHDDLDVEIGNYKITQKRPRTHKGLDSIEAYTQEVTNMHYIRLGIMPEEKPMEAKKYVLSRIPGEQRHQIIKAAETAAERLLDTL